MTGDDRQAATWSSVLRNSRIGDSWRPALLIAVSAGAAFALFADFAYYSLPLQPLAHGLAIWFFLAAVTGYRRPPALAMACGVLCLAAGVIVFYLGRSAIHDIRQAGSGSTLPVDGDTLRFWLAGALIVGVVAGLSGAFSAEPSYRGALWAALVGILVGEACGRLRTGRGADAAVVVDLLAALISMTVAARACGTFLAAAVSAAVVGVAVAFSLYPTN